MCCQNDSLVIEAFGLSIQTSQALMILGEQPVVVAVSMAACSEARSSTSGMLVQVDAGTRKNKFKIHDDAVSRNWCSD